MTHQQPTASNLTMSLTSHLLSNSHQQNDRATYVRRGVAKEINATNLTTVTLKKVDSESEEVNRDSSITTTTNVFHRLQRRKSGGDTLLAAKHFHTESNIVPTAFIPVTATSQPASWGFVKQLKNINRFINKFKEQTSTSSFTKLQRRHLQLINDLSF